MEEKISLAGHTKDVKAALANAHLLLQMTHIDAMPLAVMDSFMPCLTSNAVSIH